MKLLDYIIEQIDNNLPENYNDDLVIGVVWGMLIFAIMLYVV